MTCAGAAAADPSQKPLWEFGLGLGAVAFADYRGADTGEIYPVPVPYLVCRGQFLRADREGVRGLLLDQPIAELNISGGATAPVHSDDTLARRGMPDLKATAEIGPSLDLHLWKSPDRQVRLDLRLPARTAVTVESAPRSIGWFIEPQVAVDIHDVGQHAGWDLGVLTGPLFADQRYHQYFYGVAPEYATAFRPAYQARGGYSGTQAVMSLSKRFPRFWIAAYAHYDALTGATFTSSPLVRSNSYWATGVGFAWMIGQSSRMVDVIDHQQ